MKKLVPQEKYLSAAEKLRQLLAGKTAEELEVDLQECTLSEQELRGLVTIVSQSDGLEDLINNTPVFQALIQISFHIYAHDNRTIWK